MVIVVSTPLEIELPTPVAVSCMLMIVILATCCAFSSVILL